MMPSSRLTFAAAGVIGGTQRWLSCGSLEATSLETANPLTHCALDDPEFKGM
jgi:hypothetical protein